MVALGFSYIAKEFEVTRETEVHPWINDVLVQSLASSSLYLELAILLFLTFCLWFINHNYKIPVKQSLNLVKPFKFILNVLCNTMVFFAGALIAIVIVCELVHFFPNVDKAMFIGGSLQLLVYSVLFRALFTDFARWSVSTQMAGK